METELAVVRSSTALSGYDIWNEIATGATATVYGGRHRQTRAPVAIKAMPKTGVSDTWISESIVREVEILRGMDHPLVIHLYEVLEDASFVYVVMEHVGDSSLLDLINRGNGISEVTAQRLFRQLVAALEYLHVEKGCAHLDVKPENILLDCNCNIRVIDFGQSEWKGGELVGPCGSPGYEAPEVMTRHPHGAAVDIWSAGVVLFASCAGSLPFDDAGREGALYARPDYPAEMSRDLVALLERMLAKDPADRATLEEIKNSPWFLAGRDADPDFTAGGLKVRSLPLSRRVTQRLVDMKLARKGSCLSPASAFREGGAYGILRTGEVAARLRDLRFGPRSLTCAMAGLPLLQSRLLDMSQPVPEPPRRVRLSSSSRPLDRPAEGWGARGGLEPSRPYRSGCMQPMGRPGVPHLLPPQSGLGGTGDGGSGQRPVGPKRSGSLECVVVVTSRGPSS